MTFEPSLQPSKIQLTALHENLGLIQSHTLGVGERIEFHQQERKKKIRRDASSFLSQSLRRRWVVGYPKKEMHTAQNPAIMAFGCPLVSG